MGTSAWRAGWKKGAAWGTAVAMAAGDEFKITQESCGSGIPEPIKDENVGDSLTGSTMQGNVSVPAKFSEIVRYEGFERRLASFLGNDVVTALETNKAGSHDMVFQPTNAGKFGTLVFDKGLGTLGDRLWEYPSVKLSSLELSHDGGRLMAAWDGLADRCVRAAGQQVNNNASLTAMTLPASGLMAIFNNLTVRLTEVTGAEGNLDAADELFVTDAKFSANRNHKGEFVSGSKAGTVDEPEQDGFPEASLTLSFPNYNTVTDDLIKQAAAINAGRVPKVYKATLVWQGPTVSGATTSQHKLELHLPALTIAEGNANAGSPGSKVPVEMKFNVVTPQVVPNGTDWAWCAIGSKPFKAVYVCKSMVDAD